MNSPAYEVESKQNTQRRGRKINDYPSNDICTLLLLMLLLMLPFLFYLYSLCCCQTFHFCCIFFVCKFLLLEHVFILKQCLWKVCRVSEWERERLLLKVQWNFFGYQMYLLSVKFTLAVMSKVPMLQHYGNKYLNHRLIENAQFYGYCLYVLYFLLLYEFFLMFFFIFLFYLSKFICIFGEI